jgi:uncharacterized membrane protein
MELHVGGIIFILLDVVKQHVRFISFDRVIFLPDIRLLIFFEII